MNSYEFTVRPYHTGLAIRGCVHGTNLPGVPDLAPLESDVPGVLIYKLIYRPFTQHHATAFTHVIKDPPPHLVMIRILLPAYREFILCSKKNPCPPHPISSEVSPYFTAGS